MSADHVVQEGATLQLTAFVSPQPSEEAGQNKPY